MEKQFTKLVHAFADVADELPDWRLRIFGAGPPAPAPDPARPASAGCGTGSSCRAPPPRCAASGPRPSICALSSRAEGYPLVLQEAMAAGVPCVSFDCASGPREIVQHEVNGLLVAPESIAGLSAALLRLGTDDDLRAAARRGGAADARASGTPTRSPSAGSAIFADARARRAGRAAVRRSARPRRPQRRRPSPVADLAGRHPGPGPPRGARAGGGRPPRRPPTSGW